MSLLETALHYRRQGLAVLPANAEGKKPYPTWQKFKQRLPTEKDLRQWFETWPRADCLAFVTGQVSDLLVLDVDCHDGKSDGFEALRSKTLPITPTAKTPHGGMHYYFACPPGRRVGSATPLPNMPGVDLLGEGHVVLAPPSPGREWYDLLSPDDVPRAPCPDWLLELAPTPKPRARADQSSPFASLVLPHEMVIHREKYISLYVSPGALTRGELVAWDQNPEVVLRLGARLCIPEGAGVNLGTAFCCVLPGHSEEKPSAAWFRQAGGTIGYHDFHKKSGDEWYSLTEVYTAVLRGYVNKLDDLQHALWHTRMLLDLGFIATAPVEHVPLPKEWLPSDRRVYECFLLLLACRWLHKNPGAPSPYTRDFAAAWSGVGEATVTRSLKRLCRAGFLRQVGMSGRLYLFLPGLPASMRAGSVPHKSLCAGEAARCLNI